MHFIAYNYFLYKVIKLPCEDIKWQKEDIKYYEDTFMLCCTFLALNSPQLVLN